MSGGKKKSKSTQTTQNTLSPWSKQQFESRSGLIDSMLAESSHGNNYVGPLVADLSDREKTARGLFEGNMGSFNPAFDEAESMIRGAGTHADFGGVSDKYMNPYTRDVVDVAVGDLNRWGDELNARSTERALDNRAYGGTGSDVERALNNEAVAREVARTTADLNYRGYNDAREYYDRDINNQVARGGMIADLAAGRHSMNMDDALTLNQFGEVDRGIEQDKLGANYNEFLRQEEDFYRRLAIQQQMLGMTPMMTNSRTDAQSVEKSSPGAMGLIGAAANIGSMFVPGGEIAGLGGLFSKNMKTKNNLATMKDMKGYADTAVG